METTTGTMRDGRVIPAQIFNGKEYHLYPGERYFSRHNKRLHRVVWEYYNGPIPKGYHIHHKDGNPWHNDIENLELVEGSEHISEHGLEHAAKDIEKLRANMRLANEASKEWHRSPEGRAWHSKHAKEQAPRERVEYTCDFCGTRYVSQKIGTAHHFCSNRCAAAFRRREGIDNITRVCEWCGKEYQSNKYDKRRFCGADCAQAYRKHKLWPDKY